MITDWSIIYLIIMLPPYCGFITFLVIKLAPKYVNRKFLFCVKCNSGKFTYSVTDKEKDFNCSKCNILMEWIEMTEDLFKLRVKSYRIIFSLLLYPIVLFLILFIVLNIVFAAFLLISCLIGMIIVGVIIDLITRKKILKYATKISAIIEI